VGKGKRKGFCTIKVRSGLAWFKTGTWKLREMRKGFEKGRWPLCTEQDDVLQSVLKCFETRKEQFCE
jgi:hypothetical protein